MKIQLAMITCVGLLLPYAAAGDTVQPDTLGTADSFGVLAPTLTNTNPSGNLPGGPTTVTGNVGASTLTGLAGSQVSGSIVSAGSVLTKAQTDATAGYNGLAAMTATRDLTGKILGQDVTILIPGIYHFDTTAQLTGLLQLDAQGQNNAVWVFQTGSSFITANNSSVELINVGASGGANDGLFWDIGSSATVASGSTLLGNIIAKDSITLATGATILNGRAIALTSTVTMDTNIIDYAGPTIHGQGLNGGLHFVDGNLVADDSATVTPAPPAFLMGLMLIGGVGLMDVVRRRRMILRENVCLCE